MGMGKATAMGVALAASLAASGAAGEIVLQSTTSTRNSGLYEHLLPMIEEETGVRVRVVAVGTGQALANARNCDGDVLLVHAREAEEAFVAEGHGVERHDLMYNDFVIVGPERDPAGIGGAESAADALRRIASVGAGFASRGDDSGTHKKETSLWRAAGIDPSGASGDWYLETGSGMGATLNVAVAKEAYALTDRATWTAFGNKMDFAVLVEGDGALHNQYGVIQVSPQRCPKVAAEAGRRVVQWLLSERGQRAIGEFRVGGRQLFFPNASSSGQ